MRRIFTHLNSRLANDSFHPLRKAFFLEDPDCPTLVVKQATRRTKHFLQLYEAEVAEGKSGWAARRAKQRWLQHTSVTVANGNFRILATMHHEWRAPAPTPGTSTSAHIHTRAQAASSAGQVLNTTRLPTPPTPLPSW